MRMISTAVAASVTALTVASTSASATDGYFAYGFGARQKALGGAGVADGRDSTTTSLNPAGTVPWPGSLGTTATNPRSR